MPTLVPLQTGNEKYKIDGYNSEFSVKDFDDERLNNIIAVLSGPMSDSAL